MTMHTLTALFTSRDRAIGAASDLRRRGLSDHVTLSPMIAQAPDAIPARTGFWAWLDILFGDSPDRFAYSDAVSRGEIILTAVVLETRVHETLRVLDHHLSTRVDRWRPSWRDDRFSATDPDDGTAPAVPDVPIGSIASVVPPPGGRTSRGETAVQSVGASAPRDDPSDAGVAGQERDGGDTLVRPPSPVQASLTRMAQDLATPPSIAMPEPDGDPLARGRSRTWKVRVGMSVVGSDGFRVGTVQAIGREAVLLAPAGLTTARHRLPEDWIETVDDRVTLKLSGSEAVLRWADPD